MINSFSLSLKNTHLHERKEQKKSTFNNSNVIVVDVVRCFFSLIFFHVHPANKWWGNVQHKPLNKSK